MAQMRLDIADLPAEPLDAAGDFHARYLSRARALLDGATSLVLVFPLADQAHHGWRLAVVQQLARIAAPAARVNAITGADAAGIEQTLAWLADAPGVTGQILTVDGNSPDIPA